MYTVYVLKSLNQNYHYIGHTRNIPARLTAHNAGKVRSTKGYRPFKVIYTEQYPTRSAAQQREYYLKSAPGNVWLRAHLQAQGRW